MQIRQDRPEEIFFGIPSLDSTNLCIWPRINCKSAGNVTGTGTGTANVNIKEKRVNLPLPVPVTLRCY